MKQIKEKIINKLLRHPDKLIEDFLEGKGEFSVYSDIQFEKRLKRIKDKNSI